jgi:hypothetical protein
MTKTGISTAKNFTSIDPRRFQKTPYGALDLTRQPQPCHPALIFSKAHDYRFRYENHEILSAPGDVEIDVHRLTLFVSEIGTRNEACEQQHNHRMSFGGSQRLPH